MGCDGGSIPRRDEMVKLKKKAEKVSQAGLATYCNPAATYMSIG